MTTPFHPSAPTRRGLDGLRAEVSASLGLRASSERRSAWPVLGHRKFRLFFAGTVVSDFGSWLQTTAQALLAYHLYHSAFTVGLISCAQFVSPLLLGPFAGVVADWAGARRTLLLTQIVGAAVAFALFVFDWCGMLGEWTLAGGALAIGSTFTFALPARNMLVGRLVPPDQARDAYVMDGVSYNLGRMLGPPAAIVIVLLAGYPWVFLANALSFLYLVKKLTAMRHGTVDPRRRSKAHDGFVIARHERMILLLLLMVAAVTVADDPVLVLGPTLTSQLHVSIWWSGGFIAALGAGSVLGSVRKMGHVPSLRLAATVLAGLGLCMIGFVTIPWVGASLLAAFGAGVTCLLANSMTKTLLTEKAGIQVGSVMAVWAIAWTGSKPVASLLDGFLASQIGLQWTGVLLALPALAPLAYVLAQPQVKRLYGVSRPDAGAGSRTVSESLSTKMSEKCSLLVGDSKGRKTHNGGKWAEDLPPTGSPSPGFCQLGNTSLEERSGTSTRGIGWPNDTHVPPCSTATSTTTPSCRAERAAVSQG